MMTSKEKTSLYRALLFMLSLGFTSLTWGAEPIELLFQWLPVEGAEKYVIEISQSADFVDPLVIDSANSTEYLWKARTIESIHWRVAADGKRKGLFSEPQKLNLADLLKNPEAYESQGVILKSPREKKSPAPASAEIMPSDPEPVAPAPQADAALDADVALPFQFSFHGGYGSQSLKLLARDLESKVSGGIPVAVRATVTFPISSSRSVVVDGEWNQFDLKPEPPTGYPFQSNLSVATSRANVMVGSEGSLLYGLSFRSILRPERAGPESLTFVNRSLVGVSLAYRTQVKSFETDVHGSAAFGTGLSQGDLTARISTPVIPSDRWRVVIGVQAGAELQLHPEIRTEISHGFRGLISIGFEWEDEQTVAPDVP